MVILNDLSGGSEWKGKPDIVITLTKELMQNYTFKTMKDNEVIYYYDIHQGIYIPSGEILIKEQMELFAPDFDL